MSHKLNCTNYKAYNAVCDLLADTNTYVLIIVVLRIVYIGQYIGYCDIVYGKYSICYIIVSPMKQHSYCMR